jgi:zinc transport system ATP-binding protein
VTTNEILLRFERVDYRYERDVALRAVELELQRGERLAVLGPNGGGKTTLLALALGLRAPSAGRIVRPVPGCRLAYVPQFPAFDRNFPIRVEEMVLDGRLRDRRRQGRFTDEDRAVADALIGRLALDGFRRSYLTELSGGELKRALVARALVAEPDLLVLDEPTASLDELSRRQLWDLVAGLPEATAVILATHDLAPATFTPNRALFVDRTVREIALEDWHREMVLCGHGHD